MGSSNSMVKCCANNSDTHNVCGANIMLWDDQIQKAREPLTHAEMSMVEDQWKKVTALGAETVGVLLFKHIFTDTPQAIDLFKFKAQFKTHGYESPMLAAHAKKVVGTVDVAVDGIRELDKLVPTLKELGLRHAGYGVLPAHYDLVGAALLKTLRDGLQDAFTPHAELAWTKVWGAVAAAMKQGAAIKDELSPEEVTLVEETWEQVEGLGAETVGVILFKNIFEIAPEAKNLFSFKNEENLYESPKLKAHGANVVNHVGIAVAHLHDLSKIAPTLQELGKKHGKRYGVQPAHYEVVGKALLKTLRTGLDKGFTPDVELAWTKVYATVQKTMLSY